MDQEYQALVVLDLLTTQMNKYANKKLKPYGLKFNELNIIRFVAQTNKVVYQKTICQNFQLPHSTVVGIVFRLEDKGWLLMGNSHFDKRHTRIVITDKGKNLIQETEDIYQDIMNKMKMILSEEEIDVLERIYVKFKDFGSVDISNYSHREKGYSSTKQGEIISYSYAKDIQLN